mgnify:CR=1 FL=1
MRMRIHRVPMAHAVRMRRNRMTVRIEVMPVAHAVRMRWNRVRMATNRVFVRSLR